eukprot:m51a1_g1175 putative cytochrome b5 type II protein (163) ;mRNA; f:381867-382443
MAEMGSFVSSGAPTGSSDLTRVQPSSPPPADAASMPPPSALPAHASSGKRPPGRPRHRFIDWKRIEQAAPQRQLTPVGAAELARCDGAEGRPAWMAVRGRVYDITAYAEFHPGGAECLLRLAGRDATACFDANHPWVNPDGILGKFIVGPYIPGSRPSQFTS